MPLTDEEILGFCVSDERLFNLIPIMPLTEPMPPPEAVNEDFMKCIRWAYDKACDDCAAKILETDVGYGQATDWAADFAGDCLSLKNEEEK